MVELDDAGSLLRAFRFNGVERPDERGIDQARDAIIAGPDGAIWFTLKDRRIGRIGCLLEIG